MSRTTCFTFCIAALVLSGCSAPTDGEDENDGGDPIDPPTIESKIGKSHYLWFDNPCPPTPTGFTSNSDPGAADQNYTDGHTCTYEFSEQLDLDQPCAVFQVQKEGFNITSGDFLSLIVTVQQWSGQDLTARFEWKDDDGIIAQVIGEPYGLVNPNLSPGRHTERLTTVADRDSISSVTLEAYVDGTFCSGATVGGGDPSRFWFGSLEDDSHATATEH